MLREAFIRKDFPKKTKEKIAQFPQTGTKNPFFNKIKNAKTDLKTNNRKTNSKQNIFDGNMKANSKFYTRKLGRVIV